MNWILRKIQKERNNIDLPKYGFREDFDWENRWQLKTEINDYLISTVDLGIDHSIIPGTHLYYETMIFNDDDPGIDCYQMRYSTKEEAEKGYKQAIEILKKYLEDNNE